MPDFAHAYAHLLYICTHCYLPFEYLSFSTMLCCSEILIRLSLPLIWNRGCGYVQTKTDIMRMTEISMSDQSFPAQTSYEVGGSNIANIRPGPVTNKQDSDQPAYQCCQYFVCCHQ